MGYAAIDWNSQRIVPQYDPEQPDPAEQQEEQEAACIRDWIDDCLVPDAFIQPLQALIEDGELFQTLLHDFRNGDEAELEQSVGALCRALESHIKRSAA